jgi:dihydrofolate reductase
MNFKIIVAMDKNNGIGLHNALPWKFKKDMRFFREMTKGDGNNAIVMGKNTYLSINKNLPERDNLVLSTSLTEIPNHSYLFKNIVDLILLCKNKKYDNVWIIGGETIYKQFIELDIISEMYITEIDAVYNCDTFFPTIPDDFQLSTTIYNTTENDISLVFKKYFTHKSILNM